MLPPRAHACNNRVLARPIRKKASGRADAGANRKSASRRRQTFIPAPAALGAIVSITGASLLCVPRERPFVKESPLGPAAFAVFLHGGKGVFLHAHQDGLGAWMSAEDHRGPRGRNRV